MPAHAAASEQPVEVTVQQPPAAAKRRKPRMRTEFPPFTTVRSGGTYDLRLYDVRPSQHANLTHANLLSARSVLVCNCQVAHNFPTLT